MVKFPDPTKKEEQPTQFLFPPGSSGGGAAPAPTSEPQPSFDTTTALGRFAEAGVNPAFLPNEMAQELRNVYAGKLSAETLAAKALNEKAALNAELAKRREAAGADISRIGQVGAQGATEQPIGITDVAKEALIKGGVAGLGSAASGFGAAGAAQLAGTAGAVALGAAAAPIGAVAGAAAAGTVAFSIVSNLKEERRQQTKVQKVKFSNSIDNIQAIITSVKNGLLTPTEAVDLYNEEIAKIYQVESNLKLLGEVQWANSRDELENVAKFRQMKFMYDRALEDAIIQNPNAVYQFPSFQQDIEVPQ
jgi:hypothetical protein